VGAAKVLLGNDVQAMRLNPLGAVDGKPITREAGLLVLKRKAIHFANNSAI
jgi:hypothetical protein